MPPRSQRSPSLHRATLLLAVAALLAVPAGAQHGPVAAAAPLDTTPPTEAHQFDFLLGDWSLVGHPHVSALVAMVHGSPTIVGTWKAWRSVEGFGIEDEMRLTTEAGDPLSYTHSLRAYDRGAHRWSSAMLDVYRTRLTTSTAVWKGGVMETNGEGTAEDGRAFWSRARYSDITADSFRFELARSYDHGVTWEPPSIVLEARRAAARQH